MKNFQHEKFRYIFKIIFNSDENVRIFSVNKYIYVPSLLSTILKFAFINQKFKIENFKDNKQK